MEENQLEEVASIYYLLKDGLICGVFQIVENAGLFFSCYHPNPFDKVVVVGELDRTGQEAYLNFASDHARTVFRDTCTYFGRRGYAVQTDSSAISDDLYRQSMWELFKKYIIPPEIWIKIKKRAKVLLNDQELEAGPKLEIAALYLMNLDAKGKPLVYLWEKWFNIWYPDEL